MNENKESPDDWKLKLRYGQLHTPYKHFTALAEGKMEADSTDYKCPAGMAWMAMKTWATDNDESADMIRVIGKQIGFTITGRIQIYDTAPEKPPREKPFGYDIAFTPFREGDRTGEDAP